MQARRPARHPGHPRRRQPRGARADQGDAATSSSPRATATGSSTAPTSTSRWSASTTGAKQPHVARRPRPFAAIHARPDGSRQTSRKPCGSARTSACAFHGRHARAARSTSTSEAALDMLAQAQPARPAQLATSSCPGSTAWSDPTGAEPSVDHRLPSRRSEIRGWPLVRGAFILARRDASLSLTRLRQTGGVRAPRAGGDTGASLRRCARAMRPRLHRRSRSRRAPRHRIFAWLTALVLPDSHSSSARSDDYFFGVLHSRVHEVWARAQGTQLRERESGFRYTPTTCFETFPFPWPPGREPLATASAPRASASRGAAALGRADGGSQAGPPASPGEIVAAIAAPARRARRARRRWLDPPAFTRDEVLAFPGSATVRGALRPSSASSQSP